MSYNLVELETLNEEERRVALEILNQFSKNGNSELYNNILYNDYEEIPVDIETFLKDPLYLGNGLVNEEGKFTVFPYWLDVLKKIFPNNIDVNYHTVVLTGAIGLGKSFEADLIILYQLYKMLCLKDPYLYYGLQPIDKITFALINITLDASKGVAWDKIQQLLQSSPWFMAHGTVKGTSNLVWQPNKNIELIAGSLPRHILGRAVFSCLDQNTLIKTNKGIFKIKDLVDKTFKVYNITPDGKIIESDTCTAKATIETTEEYQITLEDGTILKCTPNHRFLLKDGITYKEAKDLTEEDELFDYNNIGYIYKITNKINGKFYIGQHKSLHFDKNYFGSGILIQRAVKKYGKSNFNIDILDWADSIEKLNKLEEYYINQYIEDDNCLNISKTAIIGNKINIWSKGKFSITDGTKTKFISNIDEIPSGWIRGNNSTGRITITNGISNRLIYSNTPIPDGWWRGSKTKGKNYKNYKLAWTDSRKIAFSLKNKGENNPGYGKGYLHKGKLNGRYGKPVSEETRLKISKARKGKGTGKCTQKGRPGVKKPRDHGLHVKQGLCKNIYIIDGQVLYGDKDLISYIKSVYNYNISSAGIKAIFNKTKRAITLYPKIIDKIIRRNKNEDK